MSVITISASDSKYGILSCNFKSTELGGKSLSDFVLERILETLNISIKDPIDKVSVFKNLINQLRDKNMFVAKSKLDTTESIDEYINKFVRSNILRMYVDYNNLQSKYKNLTDSEKKILSDTLMGYYLRNDIPNKEFNKIINDSIFELRTQSGETLMDIFEENMNNDVANLTKQIIKIMDDGINLRLRNSDFVNTLSKFNVDVNGDINATVPDVEDKDDLEQLNILLLSKYRKSLEPRIINKILQDIDSSSIISITTAFLKLIVGVRNYTRDVKGNEITLNDETVLKILETTFPFCNNIIIVKTEVVPSAVTKTIKDTNGLSDITPSVVWDFIQYYMVVKNEVTDYSISVDMRSLYEKVYVIGDIILENTSGSGESLMLQNIDSGNVKIYTIPGCKWCDKTKELLNDRRKKTSVNTGVKLFEEIQFTDEIKQTLVSVTGLSESDITFPVITINNQYIGGYTELKKIIG